jgi:D-threo-aldose 1-dehydrogenase
MDATTRCEIRPGGPAVTKLGLGCAPLGGLYEGVSDAEAHDVVAQALALGLRFFDTAPLYGSGLSERRLGDALRDAARDDIVVSTKVGRVLDPGEPSQLFPGAPPLASVFDFSHDGVFRSLAESLDRLGLDRVDLALIHDPDDHYEEALRGAYPALERLRDEGVVRAIGVGMNSCELLIRFARESDVDCFLVAGRYTLLDASADDQLLPLCLERGIAVIAGGVFNSGILADPHGGARFDYAPAPPVLQERVRVLADVCADWGVPLQAAALQFPLGHPAVTAVLVGCRSAAEVAEDVRLFELGVPAGLWDELRELRLAPADGGSVP